VFPYADRLLKIENGTIVSDTVTPTPQQRKPE
jgi:hypothetical protein